MQRSSLYQEFLAEREEILRHKWIESEKVGYDIGFERALLDWIRNHRDQWRSMRREDSEAVSSKQPISSVPSMVKGQSGKMRPPSIRRHGK